MFLNQTTKNPPIPPSFLLIKAQPFFIKKLNAVENCNINVPILSTIALNKQNQDSSRQLKITFYFKAIRPCKRIFQLNLNAKMAIPFMIFI